ncbi:hypothetical protein [Angustibacter aerolatus]|uniref:Fluoride ion transporter CrcB n=1 Tax=Angustibacter aerolatus TaxID=1162965 RepID=A0ABQ6JIZ6_9ACTN|nr:hypothetical protein GCM10025868_34180 [Angustibacter aerolatus]
MSVVHRPTLVRAAVFTAGATFVLSVLSRLAAPSLIDLTGSSSAHTLLLVVGCLVRVLAGRAAARPAWQAGADLAMVLVSVSLGALLGWVVFPGVLSVIGLLAVGATLQESVRLGVDVVLWVACAGLGGALARLALPRVGRRAWSER